MAEPRRIHADERRAVADEKQRIGAVISVNGSHALVMLDPGEGPRRHRPQLGAILCIDAGSSVALGIVSAMSVPAPTLDHDGSDARLIEVELVGEFSKATAKNPARFRRGVSTFPSLGDSASVAAREELAALFASHTFASVRVGVVKQDIAIPATVGVNEIFSRHCAFVGTTGAGKSCAIALTIRQVLERFPHGRIVIIDPHNEYARCFGDRSVVFDPTSLTLPYWLLTFEELCEILFPNGRADDEIDILADLMPQAKKMNLHAMGAGARIVAERRGEASTITVDTPVPYRVSDILGLIDRALGGLDSSRAIAPFKRLKNRLQAVSQDGRYQFMFGSLTVQDTMSRFLGQLFRIPVQGQPVSIIELGGLPSEVAQVVVSVVARLAFEFGLWSNGVAPVALVVEDAHRYAPAREDEGFGPTRRALVRIAKEGRKTGVALWVASQRPTELDPTVLSQCNTIFAMRLANQADQDALKSAIPDASSSLLSCLPSLGMGEAVAVGEGVPLPTRIRFDALPREAVPRSLTASFSDGWTVEMNDSDFIERIVEQWRAQKLIPPEV
ncbi:MAG: ATP-binding protein [Parvularculaceae bacterium]|nr:ATP-binding protein [Parvularculaceae bacterium]